MWAGTEFDCTPFTLSICIGCCVRHDRNTSLGWIQRHEQRHPIPPGEILFLAGVRPHTQIACKLRHDGDTYRQKKGGTCRTAVVNAVPQVTAYALHSMVVLSSGRLALISLLSPLVPQPMVLAMYAPGGHAFSMEPWAAGSAWHTRWTSYLTTCESERSVAPSNKAQPFTEYANRCRATNSAHFSVRQIA